MFSLIFMRKRPSLYPLQFASFFKHIWKFIFVKLVLLCFDQMQPKLFRLLCIGSHYSHQFWHWHWLCLYF